MVLSAIVVARLAVQLAVDGGAGNVEELCEFGLGVVADGGEVDEVSARQRSCTCLTEDMTGGGRHPDRLPRVRDAAPTGGVRRADPTP